MVNNKYDYIVIGGGLNSLIAAALLAKKNNSVILFESNNSLGGMASTYEFSSGFRCNLVYDYIKWLDERVLKELNIKNDELEIINNDIYRISLDLDGKHIFFNRDNKKTIESLDC